MDITLVYILRKAERYSSKHRSAKSNVRWRYYRSCVIQKTVNSRHRSIPSSPPPNDDITAIRLREIVCDIHSDRKSEIEHKRGTKHLSYNLEMWLMTHLVST